MPAFHRATVSRRLSPLLVQLAIWVAAAPLSAGGTTLPCPEWATCQASPSCRTCLNAVAPFVGTPTLYMNVVHRDVPRSLFAMLDTTPACSANTTSALLVGALAEVSGSPECRLLAGLAPDECSVVNVECFNESSCRPCLRAAYHDSLRARDVLLTGPCATAPAEIRDRLAQNCRT